MVFKVDNLVNRSYSNLVNPRTLEYRINRMRLPSHERSLVSELTSVISRHKDQAPARLAQLISISFGAAIGSLDSREGKLARAYLRGVEAWQQLAEAEGGSCSSDEVARLLQISKTAALKRLAAGRLLAWEEERLGAKRFPRWQFDDQGHVQAGLEAVLAILNRDTRLDVRGKMLFFLQTKPTLGNRRPLDLLREGKLKEAQLAAEGYVE